MLSIEQFQLTLYSTSTKNEQTRGFAALSCEIADSTMSSKLQSNDIKTLQRETKYVRELRLLCPLYLTF